MTNELLDVLIIIGLFFLFGYSHSFLASVKVKKYAARRFGDFMAFYRMTYNIISFLSLYLIYEISPKPDMVIYDLKYPFDFIIIFPQMLALAGILWAAKYFCLKEFLGIDQIKRWQAGNYDPSELDEKMTLTIEGPFKFVRHPIYFFSIMFLLFRPTMDLFYLTFVICIAIYFYVGSIYEEKKLIEYFGDTYINYKNAVPRIIPTNLFHPYKPIED